MYNLRYHVASLVAVFLALAVGMLLGSVVAERGMITDQSDALVKSLERRFADMQTANDLLKEELDRDHGFALDATPLLLEGRLEQQSVVLVVGTGRVDGLDAARTAVQQAGGTTTLVSLRSPGLGLDSAAPDWLAEYFADRDVTMAGPGLELQEQVAGMLAEEWRDHGSRPLTELMIEEGLLTVEELEGMAGTSRVIVLPSGQGPCDPVGLAVVRSMAQAGGIGVVAESSTAGEGVAQDCAEQGLSAVDHVDTPQGAVSLVWILAGEASGYYGSGTGATASYPPLISSD